MRTPRRFSVLLARLLFALASVVALISASGAWPAEGPWGGEALLLLLFFSTILSGSTMQRYDRGRSTRTVDVGATAALALTAVFALPSHAVDLSTSQIVAVVALGLVGGGIIGTPAPHRPALALVLRRTLPRILTVAVLSFFLRDLGGSHALLEVLQTGSAKITALLLLALLYVALVVEAPVRAELNRRPDETRRVAHVAELGESLSLGIIPASTAVLVAMAQPVLGLPALPLLLLPLVFNQVAVRRHEEMREHSHQSVVALSRMPEALGVVRAGHAARVSRLAGDLARELGLGRREVLEVERAALLHDLGQVRSARAVPSGATVLAAPADQQDIAQTGADIARRTGVLDAEADVMQAQASPYHHHVSHAHALPLGSRILKVANAYDDLLTGESAGLPLDDPEAVLERIYLGLGHEYDPRVVDALDRVLHDGVSATGAAVGDDSRT
ncbi:HD-GYP domain-containing protein [Mobilicoccus massiliensis]|uniref:HD-GYP domain-containing protein n=1 Tax=Mobilicoccus massiliensis TaxID=1522310 RepID=UPI00069434EB|nr:HD domain-containing protein [Mobilicoccus massiliensis]